MEETKAKKEQKKETKSKGKIDKKTNGNTSNTEGFKAARYP